MWNRGTLTINNRDYTYAVKSDGGRISKLTLWDNGTMIARYDRGWNLETAATDAQTALATILELHT